MHALGALNLMIEANTCEGESFRKQLDVQALAIREAIANAILVLLETLEPPNSIRHLENVKIDLGEIPLDDVISLNGHQLSHFLLEQGWTAKALGDIAVGSIEIRSSQAGTVEVDGKVSSSSWNKGTTVLTAQKSIAQEVDGKHANIEIKTSSLTFKKTKDPYTSIVNSVLAEGSRLFLSANRNYVKNVNCDGHVWLKNSYVNDSAWQFCLSSVGGLAHSIQSFEKNQEIRLRQASVEQIDLAVWCYQALPEALETLSMKVIKHRLIEQYHTDFHVELDDSRIVVLQLAILLSICSAYHDVEASAKTALVCSHFMNELEESDRKSILSQKVSVEGQCFIRIVAILQRQNINHIVSVFKSIYPMNTGSLSIKEYLSTNALVLLKVAYHLKIVLPVTTDTGPKVKQEKDGSKGGKIRINHQKIVNVSQYNASLSRIFPFAYTTTDARVKKVLLSHCFASDEPDTLKHWWLHVSKKVPKLWRKEMGILFRLLGSLLREKPLKHASIDNLEVLLLAVKVGAENAAQFYRSTYCDDIAVSTQWLANEKSIHQLMSLKRARLNSYKKNNEIFETNAIEDVVNSIQVLTVLDLQYWKEQSLFSEQKVWNNVGDGELTIPLNMDDLCSTTFEQACIFELLQYCKKNTSVRSDFFHWQDNALKYINTHLLHDSQAQTPNVIAREWYSELEKLCEKLRSNSLQSVHHTAYYNTVLLLLCIKKGAHKAWTYHWNVSSAHQKTTTETFTHETIETTSEQQNTTSSIRENAYVYSERLLTLITSTELETAPYSQNVDTIFTRALEDIFTFSYHSSDVERARMLFSACSESDERATFRRWWQTVGKQFAKVWSKEVKLFLGFINHISIQDQPKHRSHTNFEILMLCVKTGSENAFRFYLSKFNTLLKVDNASPLGEEIHRKIEKAESVRGQKLSSNAELAAFFSLEELVQCIQVNTLIELNHWQDQRLLLGPHLPDTLIGVDQVFPFTYDEYDYRCLWLLMTFCKNHKNANMSYIQWQTKALEYMVEQLNMGDIKETLNGGHCSVPRLWQPELAFLNHCMQSIPMGAVLYGAYYNTLLLFLCIKTGAENTWQYHLDILRKNTSVHLVRAKEKGIHTKRSKIETSPSTPLIDSALNDTPCQAPLVNGREEFMDDGSDAEKNQGAEPLVDGFTQEKLTRYQLRRDRAFLTYCDNNSDMCFSDLLSIVRTRVVEQVETLFSGVEQSKPLHADYRVFDQCACDQSACDQSACDQSASESKLLNRIYSETGGKNSRPFTKGGLKEGNMFKNRNTAQDQRVFTGAASSTTNPPIATAKHQIIRPTSLHRVNDAGLVLLYPFLKNLVQHCGLPSNYKDPLFRNQLLSLLYYLVWKKDLDIGEDGFDASDFGLSLLMAGFTDCKYELENPPPLNDQLKEHADNLMQAIQLHWPILARFNRDLGIQRMFIQRTAGLQQRDKQWLLEVKNQGHDILLKQCPWAYTSVTLPWLDYEIKVTWPTGG